MKELIANVTRVIAFCKIYKSEFSENKLKQWLLVEESSGCIFCNGIQ